MDVQILKAILQSHSEVMKNLQDPKNFDRSLEEQKFPPIDRSVLSALTRSFTDLIIHKVSSEAYQRYSVRIQVIEILREWIRPWRELNCSRTFFQRERVLEFTAKILRIYLTNELLYGDDGNIDDLVNLAKALICLIPKRRSFVHDLQRILMRIGTLEQTEDSESLFINALEEKDSLKLDSRTIENLYVAQRVKLIEAPIVENFIDNLKDYALNREFRSSESLDKLLQLTIDSTTIFHTTCSVLKEIFVNSDYSPRVMDYIEYYLDSLETLCQKREKNILDLYPLGSQALIILLRIIPDYHTSCSREHTIESLVKTHLSNPDETLIIMTHFPRWLHLLTNRLTENSLITTEESTLDEQSDRVTSMIVDDELTV